MTQYLAPILRAQFTLFYRFGRTFLPKAALIPFQGIWNEGVNELLVEKFRTLPPFQYDEEYVILHLEKEEEGGADIIPLEITEVCAIYPLSAQARHSISLKIDERIRLEQPISSRVLDKIEQQIAQEEMYRAFDALWKIFDIKTPLQETLQSINLHEIIEGLDLRRKGLKPKNVQGKSYYSYLIAYDRYGFFPKTKLGYFYDAGEVFAYYKGKPTFEGSRIFELLEQLQREGGDLTFGKIVRTLQESPLAKDYIEQTSGGAVRNYILAPMYFMFKEEFKEAEDIEQTVAYKTKEKLKDFQKEFEVVLVLLGAFFGYQKFYDAYYNKAGLRFYKNRPLTKPLAEPVEVTEEPKVLEAVPEQTPKNETSHDEGVKQPDQVNSEPNELQGGAIKQETAVAEILGLETESNAPTEVVDAVLVEGSQAEAKETNGEGLQIVTDIMPQAPEIKHEGEVLLSESKEEVKNEPIVDGAPESNDVRALVVEDKIKPATEESAPAAIQEKESDPGNSKDIGLKKQIYRLLEKKHECSMSDLKKELKKHNKRDFEDEEVLMVVNYMDGKVVIITPSKGKRTYRFALKREGDEKVTSVQEKKAEQIQLQMD